MNDTKTEQELNIEVLEMNKALIEQNSKVLENNQNMAIEEHASKMELYSYQKQKMMFDLSKDKEPFPLRDVADFHTLFGHPIQAQPIIPGKDRCDLRVSLIQEELDEFKKAITDGDLVEVADALADLQYVLSGSILEFGLGERFKYIFEEVQRSNMSKACKSEEEAQRTVDHYKINKDTDAYFREVGGLFLVFRKEDDKVLKSVDYSPANLKELV